MHQHLAQAPVSINVQVIEKILREILGVRVVEEQKQSKENNEGAFEGFEAGNRSQPCGAGPLVKAGLGMVDRLLQSAHE
jgi:hypothetical protein